MTKVQVHLAGNPLILIFTSSRLAALTPFVGVTACRTDNCIYLISSKVCSKQYIREIGDLHRRINNHCFTIKTKNIKVSVGDNLISVVTNEKT